MGEQLEVRLPLRRNVAINYTLTLLVCTLLASKAMAASGAPDSSDWLSRAFASRGNVIGFLLVLLGGLALNLTPCVYPLIGVTIAYFGNQGGGPRRVLILAILFVLGIAIMFSSVGVAVALSGGLFGAAMQNPYVLSAVAAMMLVLAASSFGFFVIQPPQFMAQWAGRREARLRRFLPDGARDGRRRRALHRPDRAGPATDGRA